MVKPLSKKRQDLFWTAIHRYGFDGTISDFPLFSETVITINELTSKSDDRIFYIVLTHVIQGIIKTIKTKRVSLTVWGITCAVFASG